MDNTIIESLAERLLATGATDLFLRSDEVPRIRIEGELYLSEEGGVSHQEMEHFWRSSGVDPVEYQEKDIRLMLPSGSHIRVNFYRSMGRLAAAIRPVKQRIPEMQELGLPVELLRSWLERRSGLILVTGATGSGKSTTLASSLADLNQHKMKHVVTIEDPIEYVFENQQSFFSQREVGVDTENFATALRAALRQNPDIIFVGEIRDDETARIALRAAETGHLVLSTLHSSGVVETMERITNLFPMDRRASSLQLLSAQLVGVLSLQLLPGMSGGLQLVYEHFQNEGASRKWISEGAYREMADFLRREENEKNSNMLTSLVRAYQAGLITEEVARAAASNPNDFNRVIRGIS